jgi:hypothetical protein
VEKSPLQKGLALEHIASTTGHKNFCRASFFVRSFATHKNFGLEWS